MQHIMQLHPQLCNLCSRIT